MKIDTNNRNVIIILAIAVLLVGVIAYLVVRMNRMEDRYMRMLAESRQAGSERGGRTQDPYLSGPVKNTVVKHSGEMLACYREFLERNKSKSDPAFKKEGFAMLDWQVDDDGAALSPGLVRSDLRDAAFHACLAKKISAWRFPEPPFGEKKYVEHTFTFRDEKK